MFSCGGDPSGELDLQVLPRRSQRQSPTRQKNTTLCAVSTTTLWRCGGSCFAASARGDGAVHLSSRLPSISQRTVAPHSQRSCPRTPMPRSEPRAATLTGEALIPQDLPGVPTANWGAYGESCLEAELRRSRVPLGCASFLVMVVMLSSVMDSDPAPSAAPAPPAPSPPVVFPSCNGRNMDCHGAESCGVVVLETGRGQGFYKHATPCKCTRHPRACV